MDLNRRTFLAGATGSVALAASALPGVALAAEADGDRLLRHVDTLRSRWASQRQDYLDSVFVDRTGAVDNPLTPYAHRLGEGLGALSTYKELETMPVEDQMHPAAQTLIRDAAAGVGGMLIASRELLEHFFERASGDPHQETHLRAAMRSVRLSLADWPTTGGRQRALEHSLLEVERESAPGALLKSVKRQISRLRRAESLSKELDARWEETGVLQIADPAVLARLEAGRRHWGVSADDQTGPVVSGVSSSAAPPARPGVDPEQRRKGVQELVLGIVVLGVGASGGAVLVLAGACALACGGGAGAAVVMLAGIAVLGLAVWLGVTFIVKGRRDIKGLAERDERAGPKLATEVHPVAVVVEEGWVDTGVDRGDGHVLVVEGVGMVRSPSGWMADADGNGTIAGDRALVPGAPICALVGRVGDDVFYVGGLGRVPAGLPGRLELAINRDDPATPRPKGHFAVQVSVMEPASVG